MDFSEKLENKKPTVRLVSFLLSIVPTSVAVSFASFMDNIFLLGTALLPCILILSLSIVPVPVSAKAILTGGIFSFFISLGVIIYTLVAHSDLLRPYMTLPF